MTLSTATMPPGSVFGMKTTTNIPNDLLRSISEWYPPSNKQFIAVNTWECTWLIFDRNQTFVDLAQLGITSVFGWNFTQHALIDDLDLSNNHIQKINDQTTDFGKGIDILSLKNNHIKSVDLRKTKVVNVNLCCNSLSGKAFASNQVQFQHQVNYLYLRKNPIGKLADYAFPKGYYLYLSDCNITSIENVIFDSWNVDLDSNPIRMMKNVTFKNTKHLSLRNCGVTFSMFDAFDINIIGSKERDFLVDDGFLNLNLSDFASDEMYKQTTYIVLGQGQF